MEYGTGAFLLAASEILEACGVVSTEAGEDRSAGSTPSSKEVRE
jgi:hypothetical protein